MKKLKRVCKENNIKLDILHIDVMFGSKIYKIRLTNKDNKSIETIYTKYSNIENINEKNTNEKNKNEKFQ